MHTHILNECVQELVLRIDQAGFQKSLAVMNGNCATDLAPNFGSVLTWCCSSNINFYAANAGNGVLHDSPDKVRLDELNA